MRSLPGFLAVLVWVAASGPAAMAADLLLSGGRIYTADERQPTAEAVLVRDGKIVYVGTARGAEARAGAAAQRLDLTGRTVVPGLTDAHVHLAGIGDRELAFNLEGTASLAELQTKLRARAAVTPKGQWIVGRGWIETKWSPATFPRAADLDAVAPDHPVFLKRSDGHALVANTRALQLAGITRATPNPRGGEILREGATEEPSGMLIDHAQTLVERLVPPEGPAEVERRLLAGAQRELSLGWTQVHIAGNGLDEMRLLRRLVAEGKIKLRIYNAVGGPGAAAEALLQGGPQQGGDGSRFTARAIKLYADGALGSRGAALLEPYADSPGSRGLMLSQAETLLPLMIQALRRGVQIETHAIGDRGNRFVLDLYAQAFAAVPRDQRRVPEPRWRIEHAQVIAPADLGRFAQLGVIASMQPSHAIGDFYFAPSRLGAARLKGAYAWRSLLDSGAVVIGGSDAPVERGEPMIEFYAAVVRRSLDGFSDENWHREERVSRAQALTMFTLAPAYAAFQEQERGSIAVGKRGDFTVLSADIMTIPETEILQTRCLMTIIEGEVVYARAR